MSLRMIGVDLDGTLLSPDGTVSRRNLSAIADAQRAGWLVVPCSGRSWPEARYILESIPGLSIGVFVGGAVVSEVPSGRSLDLVEFEPHLAHELVQALFDQPEAVLIFRDKTRIGHDYLITGSGTLSPNTQWWFEFTQVTARFQREATVEDLHHCLRVGMVASGARLAKLTPMLRSRFEHRVQLQSFEALVSPEEVRADRMHLLEIFAAGVDKWRGLCWIADREGIAAGEVAAIGDEINDVAMLRAAGCGIAMGNAQPAVKSAARFVTADNTEDGFALAIDRLLRGEWS